MEHFLKIGESIPDRDVWNQLMLQWYTLMDKAIKSFNIEEPKDEQKDLPYWYQEYTNIGFLAGAIWSLGGIVVEQLGVKKSNSTGIESQGRCDFLFEINNQRCYVEAKIEWPCTSDNIPEKITKKLDEAKEQLKNIENRSGNGMVMCFVVPMICGLSDIDAFNRANRIFDKVKKYFIGNNNIIAIYIPSGNVKIEDEGYYYPGVALVGELVD